MYPFERFTESAKKVLTSAQEEAHAAGVRYIGTEHLALALCRDQQGTAGRVLAELGITYEALKAQVIGITGVPAEHKPLQIIPTSRVKRVVEMAFQEATNSGAEFVGTQHLLAALLVEAEGVAPLALDQLGVTLPKVRRAIRAGLEDRVDPGQPTPADHVGTSSPVGIALMRAGQLARDEGVRDIRADHLLRAMAESGISELHDVLRKVGLAPEAVASAMAVPDEIRKLGQAARQARVAHAGAFTAGGDDATRAIAEVERLSRGHDEALSRWLHEPTGS